MGEPAPGPDGVLSEEVKPGQSTTAASAGTAAAGTRRTGLSASLEPLTSLDGDQLGDTYGARPVWVELDSGEFNTMAEVCYKTMGVPKIALQWLFFAMEKDARNGSEEFACVSALHLAAIHHALARHGAAIDVLESLLETLVGKLLGVMTEGGELVANLGRVEVQGQLGLGGGESGLRRLLLLLAVCHHNLGVQQLLLDQAERAVHSCEQAMRLMQQRDRRIRLMDERSGSISASRKEAFGRFASFMHVCTAQMEVSWLAARLAVEKPRVRRALRRAASPLRDSRRTLLALAPLAPQPRPRARSSEGARMTAREKRAAKLASTAGRLQQATTVAQERSQESSLGSHARSSLAQQQRRQRLSQTAAAGSDVASTQLRNAGWH